MFAIRRYCDTDQVEVLALHVLALERVGAYLGAGAWYADLNDIPGNYFANQGEFLVGVEQERIVAMGALLRTTAERAEIKRMRTQPDAQGRGFGTLMLVTLEDRALALGYHTLHLDTSSEQAAALSLYRRHGYRETCRDQVRGLELIYMEKHLPTVPEQPGKPNTYHIRSRTTEE